MNANRHHRRRCSRACRVALGTLTLLAVASLRADDRSKNPTSKFYVADIAGKSEVNTGEKIVELSEKSVFSAEGTVIETKSDSTNSIVMSNGTGIFLDPDTRLEVKRFLQEPFQPDRTDLETEPSISQTRSYIPRGTVGLCSSKLVAGSTMRYTTPLVEVNIRAQKLVIETNDNQTVVSAIDGEVTLRGEGFVGGEPLSSGQQAVITRSNLNQPPKIVIRPIPQEDMPVLGTKVAQACMARRTVYFDIAERENENNQPELELIVEEVTPVDPDDIGPVVSASAITPSQ
ncbi:MAG: hypothetical protein ABII82_06835 [Verrucomicrobiota bacterium]